MTAKIISLAWTIVCYDITILYSTILLIEASVLDPSWHLFDHLVRPAQILSIDCGVLIIDQICLVIPGPRRFPDLKFHHLAFNRFLLDDQQRFERIFAGADKFDGIAHYMQSGHPKPVLPAWIQRTTLKSYINISYPWIDETIRILIVPIDVRRYRCRTKWD